MTARRMVVISRWAASITTVAVIAAFALSSQGAHAQEAGAWTDRDGGFRGIKNVVLVHGAWADGSSWSKVIPLLEARGMHVVAVQSPLTSLADDVAATKRVRSSSRTPKRVT